MSVLSSCRFFVFNTEWLQTTSLAANGVFIVQILLMLLATVGCSSCLTEYIKYMLKSCSHRNHLWKLIYQNKLSGNPDAAGSQLRYIQTGEYRKRSFGPRMLVVCSCMLKSLSSTRTLGTLVFVVSVVSAEYLWTADTCRLHTWGVFHTSDGGTPPQNVPRPGGPSMCTRMAELLQKCSSLKSRVNRARVNVK